MQRDEAPPPIIAVIGPTGAGKSSAAVAMALAIREAFPRLTPHIVNADVTQMYPGLPIASNKPMTDEDTGGIPHHFIGQLEARQEYNVRLFVRDLLALMREVRQQELSPIFLVCGGTHYYVQGALIDGDLSTSTDDGSLDEAAQPVDAVAVTSLQTETMVGNAETKLWDVLHRIDPEAAKRWHPNDEQRIARLLDIHCDTGRMPSDIMAAQQHPTLRRAVTGNSAPLLVAVNCSDRVVLEKRINIRVDQMVNRGLLEEVQAFYKGTLPSLNGGASDHHKPRFLDRAIGFKEFIPVLSRSVDSPITRETSGVATALEEMKINTRRYALQQQQWIRNRFVGKYATLFAPHFFTIESGASANQNAAALAIAWLQGKVDTDASALPAGVSRIDASQQAASRDMTTYHCEACHVTLCGAKQRDAHMASGRHRDLVKRQRAREARAAAQDPRPQPSAET